MVALYNMRKFLRAGRSYLPRFACALFIPVLFITIFASDGFAQTTGTLTLDNIEQQYLVAPYSYITTDDEQLLSPDTLISRHRNNLKGKRLGSDIIHFKATPHSTWIVFSIYNKTPQDNWILDFGSTLDGRMGLIKNINIMNYSTKQTLIYPKDENDRSSPFLGSAIPVRIAPGTQSTFVLYVEADSGFPLIISPTIKSQDAYMAELVNGDVSNVFALGLFICMMGFFAASYFIGRNKASIALFSYYVLLCALYFNLNVHLVSGFPINGSSLLFTYVASFSMLLVATKFFSKIEHDFKPIENMALIALFIMVFSITALGNFIFGHSPLGISTICGAVFLCSFLTCIISFFSSEKTIIVKSLFCGAILMSGVSALTLILPIVSILPDSSFSSLLFWMCFFLQAALFIAAYLRSNMERKSRHQQDLLKQEHEGQSLLRLQKSKDSADHARLLRVIERERELMAELREREVKRTEEMRGAKEIADNANKAKSAFLAVVSHEIRTPMNGILGMVQLMQQTELTTKQKEYINTVKNSGDTMMALLNDILDFEKIERGGMELETVNFDLRRLANDVVTLMSGHAAQKNITLAADISSDVPKFVSGDPTRLRQVLLNLVNNGLKFTSEGHVTIRINVNDDQTLYFAITDSGIGISKEAQEKLFTPFTQAETSTTRKYGGTGLGLAISLRLIEAMGGKIEVQSQEGVGSTFFFNIKLTSQDHADAQSYTSSTDISGNKNTTPMTILVVEDNEMNRQVLDGLLTNKGHKVLMAANGLEAIEICKKNAEMIDIILMDIQMAGMDGVEATKILRADPSPVIARKPIIALTGNVVLEEVQHYFEIGINGFVAKPVNADELYETLENASQGKLENPLPDIQETPEPTGGNHAPVKKDSAPITEVKDKPKDDANPSTTNRTAEQSSQPNEVSNKLAEVSQSNSIDITEDINPNIQFDNRDHFVDDSALKNKIKTQDPFFSQDVGLSFEDQNAPLSPSDPSKKIQEKQSPKATKEFKPIKSPGEMTEIQKYLMEQHSKPEDHSDKEKNVISHNSESVPKTEEPETAIKKAAPIPSVIEESNAPVEMEEQNDSALLAPSPEPANEIESVAVDDFLDNDMLQSLLSSLGPEPFFNLLNGFVTKTEEIIGQSIQALEAQDTTSLAARAHELKGMAGNFGLKHVSALSGEIEKMAKTGQKEQAFEQTKKLNAAYVNTQAALEKWRESQN